MIKAFDANHFNHFNLDYWTITQVDALNLFILGRISGDSSETVWRQFGDGSKRDSWMTALDDLRSKLQKIQKSEKFSVSKTLFVERR